MSESVATVGPAEADFCGTDSQALQAAVDATAEGGGRVVILPGVYTMHDSLHLRSGVHVTGSGSDTVLRKAPEVRSVLSADLGYGQPIPTGGHPTGRSPRTAHSAHDHMAYPR